MGTEELEGEVEGVDPEGILTLRGGTLFFKEDKGLAFFRGTRGLGVLVGTTAESGTGGQPNGTGEELEQEPA